MTATTSTPADTERTMEDTAALLMSHVAGYVGMRTVEIGLRHGLLDHIDDHPDGISAERIAADLDLDPFYVAVWCRSALAAAVLDRAGDGFTLAPHMATLLLDTAAPVHNGGVFRLLTQPEMFDALADRLASGERLWWDDASHEFVQVVGESGRPFYTRLIPGGLEQVPGLTAMLRSGGAVLDTACGTGVGLVRLAETYPEVAITGADGDAYSLELAERRVADAGVSDRIRLVHTPLEDMEFDGDFDLVTNNISMHECRDLDAVAANVRRALRPGGWFVISDLPFPTDDEGLRTTPGRVMAGIQFWEAVIDDQLQPVDTYLDLLERRGFRDVDTVTLTPVHAVTFGRR